MKPIENWDEIQDSSVPTLKPGAWPVKFKNITLVPLENPQDETSKGNYLLVEFDIVEGEFKNYYKIVNDAFGGDWRGRINASFKTKALPIFKRFITAVEKSNPGYKWDWNEKGLIGKFAVVTFREEEYINKDGNLATIVKPYEFRSLVALRNGDIKPDDYKKKCIEKTTIEPDKVQPTIEVSDDDLPF